MIVFLLISFSLASSLVVERNEKSISYEDFDRAIHELIEITLGERELQNKISLILHFYQKYITSIED